MPPARSAPSVSPDGSVSRSALDGRVLLPSADARVEWWYVNALLDAADGRRFGAFAAFFRHRTGTGARAHAHSVVHALIDLGTRRSHVTTRLDAAAVEHARARALTDASVEDTRFAGALATVLASGEVPRPDLPVDGELRVEPERLLLAYGLDRLEQGVDGEVRLDVRGSQGSGTRVRLALTPGRPYVRGGHDGRVDGPRGERMEHVFVPRLAVTGAVEVEGSEVQVGGVGWLDREVERPAPPASASVAAPDGAAVGWEWFALHADGVHGAVDVHVFALNERESGVPRGRHATVTRADGTTTRHEDAVVEAKATWRSVRTFLQHVVRWRVSVRSAGIELDVVAAFEDQEVRTLAAEGAFWEGVVSAQGTILGRAAVAHGFAERRAAPHASLEAFFAAVGEEVRATMAEVFAVPTDATSLARLACGPGREDAVEGLDPSAFHATVLAPIREISDRGGKSWRSWAALAAVEVVGGDARPYRRWLAMAEALHVGSLIVDDVEDRSEMRRGGASCHRIHGEAAAINAGTAAYFLAEVPADDVHLSDAERLRVYRLYFAAMRAGHAGQGADLVGFESIARRAAETGDVVELVARILAVHRLKTAVPAGNIARIGAIGGHGTSEQVEGIGRFFETLGLAFQIVDDVLDVRGFGGSRKARGEDVRLGKATLPVARALERLGASERREFWGAISARPSSRGGIDGVLAAIEATGALDVCLEDARARVDAAWERFAPLVPASQAKTMLRAFSRYVLERHY